MAVVVSDSIEVDDLATGILSSEASSIESAFFVELYHCSYVFIFYIDLFINL